MRILVTGGAGFIASRLADRLLQLGHEVTIVDNLSTGYRESVPRGARFVWADLGNPSHYYRLADLKPEAIFHLGGQSSGWISMDSPLNDVEDNLHSTIHLADWALARGCRRFLYASSESVYGEGSATRAHLETDNPHPKSFYGCSKHASEDYLRVFGAESGLQPTCLRLFTVYGAGQDLANLRQGILSIYLSLVVAGEPLVVKGSLDRIRDFVYVDDAVQAFVTCLGEPRTIGRELNVATGVPIRLRDAIRTMLEHLGRPDTRVVEEAGTPGDVMASYGSAKLLTELTGWKPTVDFEEGMRRFTAAFVRH